MDSLGEIKIVDSLMLPDSCDLTMFINCYDHERGGPRRSTPSRSRSARSSSSRSARSTTRSPDDGDLRRRHRRRRRRLRPRRHHGRGPRLRPRRTSCTARRKVRVFQNQTSTDAVKKMLSEAASAPRRSIPAAPPTTGSSRTTRPTGSSSGGWRGGSTSGCSSRARRPASSRRARAASHDRPRVARDDSHAFHPRVTGVQQVEKVTRAGLATRRTKQALVDQQDEPRAARRDRPRPQDGEQSDLDGGEHPHLRVESAFEQGEVDKLAQATLDRIANAYVEADGHVQGNPKIKAGRQAQDQRRRAEVQRHLHRRHRATHSRPGRRRVRDALLDRHRHAHARSRRWRAANGRAQFGDQLVIGIVTNNNDPERLGPREGEVPGARATADESGWLRIATPSAGKARGAADAPAARRGGRSSASRTATPGAATCSARSSTARTSPATI